jgi:hypothetical protein
VSLVCPFLCFLVLTTSFSCSSCLLLSLTLAFVFPAANHRFFALPVLLPKLKVHCSGTDTYRIYHSLVILTRLHEHGDAATKAAVKGCLDAARLQQLTCHPTPWVAETATALQAKLASI